MKWTSAVLLIAASGIGIRLAMKDDVHERPESKNRLHHHSTPQSASTNTQDAERTTRQKNENDESAGAISRLLSSGRQEDKIMTMQTLLPALIAQDAAAAARTVESLEAWAWREDALHVLARTWAPLDSDRAARWAATLPNEAERSTALSDIAIEMAKVDPGKALVLIMKHGMDDPGNTTFLHLAQLWAVKDADAAVDWITLQPESVFRNQAFSRVAISKAAVDPADAARFAMERITPGALQGEAVVAVLHQWLSRDPVAAESWVQRFPAGDLKLRAESEINGFKTYQASGN